MTDDFQFGIIKICMPISYVIKYEYMGN